MSHYSLIATRMKSAKHLVKALSEMGYRNIEVHETPQTIHGFGSNKYRAEIILRGGGQKTGNYDLGFQNTPDQGFVAVIEDLDRKKFGEEWLQEVSRKYAYNVACETLQEQGFSIVTETRAEDESVHLVVRRMT